MITEMDIKFKIGKKYKCRNGNTALITNYIDKLFPRELYQVGGKILNEDGSINRKAYWTVTGRYNLSKESGFDLID